MVSRVSEPTYRIPAEPLPRLFWRFLRFGLLAWGGPVAQIGLLHRELVEEERWISPADFNRALALYQVLPGPEASELCVYLGMRSRGRIGGFLAGLGFLLPGLTLILALSWAYVRFGLRAPAVQAAFVAVQAAVTALIVRAIHRIGSNAISSRFDLWIALAVTFAHLGGVHFAICLAVAGAAHLGRLRGRVAAGFALLGALVVAAVLWAVLVSPPPALGAEAVASSSGGNETPSLARLALSGLRAGLLTFGGAYTAIPLLQHDAVVAGRWMTDAQFLDGIALSGVLPAPLIIFATFVGWIGGGLTGALVMTAGVFAPAFGFTLLVHDPLERLVQRPGVRQFLDGVTVGVVGLIAATTLGLLRSTVTSPFTAAVFGLALLGFFRLRSRLAIPAVLVAAALVGAGRLLAQGSHF
jgi:chromate transporter